MMTDHENKDQPLQQAEDMKILAKEARNSRKNSVPTDLSTRQEGSEREHGPNGSGKRP